MEQVLLGIHQKVLPTKSPPQIKAYYKKSSHKKAFTKSPYAKCPLQKVPHYKKGLSVFHTLIAFFYILTLFLDGPPIVFFFYW